MIMIVTGTVTYYSHNLPPGHETTLILVYKDGSVDFGLYDLHTKRYYTRDGDDVTSDVAWWATLHLPTTRQSAELEALEP